MEVLINASLLYAGSLLGEAQSEDRRLLHARKEYGEKGHDEIVIDLDKMSASRFNMKYFIFHSIALQLDMFGLAQVFNQL